MNKDAIILLIEDDFDNQFVVKYFLEQSNYTVIVANNGKEGLEKLEEQNPDIILLDIMMPVMDGYQTIKRIRKDPKIKDIPVISLTANAQVTEKEKCLKSGFDQYIEKPIDLIFLLSSIKKMLKEGRPKDALCSSKN